MEFVVLKFRTNDLHESLGKQIEFNPTIVDNFFKFSNQIEKAKFIYKTEDETDANNNTEINVTLKLSPSRGDYKIYQNEDGSLFLKTFLLDNLGLNLTNNLDDYISIKKLNHSRYEFSYISKDTEIGRYFKKIGLGLDGGSVVGDDAGNNDMILFPCNRIIFGAPGTGKSYRLNEDSKLYFNGTIPDSEYYSTILNEIKDTLSSNGENMEMAAISVGLKYKDFLATCLKTMTVDQISEKIGITNDILGDHARTDMFLPAKACSDEELINYCSIERVTFHPNYLYSQFVGSYKPVSVKEQNEDKILYKFVPGPFIKTYIKAVKSKKNVLLIIEEINRANVASVFGDTFQLLDRDKSGNSQYPISISDELKAYLALKGIYTNTLSIPSNMYIWATMNSADQGVLPMDAAFKRRWDFEYIGINDGEDKVQDIEIALNGNKFNWNLLRKDINKKIKKDVSGVNEDKLLGPFFINLDTLTECNVKGVDSETDDFENKQKAFSKVFKSKILMYLYEDVCKMDPVSLFSGFDLKGDESLYYSDICEALDGLNSKGEKISGAKVKGLKIFGDNFAEDALITAESSESETEQNSDEETE